MVPFFRRHSKAELFKVLPWIGTKNTDLKWYYFKWHLNTGPQKYQFLNGLCVPDEKMSDFCSASEYQISN